MRSTASRSTTSLQQPKLLRIWLVRRRPLRVSRGGRARTAADVSQDAGRRIRSGSKTAHHAGNLRLSAGYYDAYYRKAQQVRALLKEDFRKAFESCDAIITPTSPTPAFLLGEKVDDPLAMYLNDIYTVTANLAGVPGLNVPCGLSSSRLPIGFQLLGPYWSEPLLFKIADAYERARPFTERPTIYAE